MATTPKPPTNKGMARLRDFALALPGAHEDFPWGERVVKVGKKVFVFLGHEGRGVRLSLKLPRSADEALGSEWAQPTGYGLGKSGWVTIDIPAGEEVDLPQLERYLEESYRAVAPKTMVKELDARATAAPSAPSAPKARRRSRSPS